MNLEPHLKSKAIVSIEDRTEAVLMSYALLRPSFKGLLQFMLFDKDVFTELREGSIPYPQQVLMSRRQLKIIRQGLNFGMSERSGEITWATKSTERTKRQIADNISEFLDKEN